MRRLLNELWRARAELHPCSAQMLLKDERVVMNTSEVGWKHETSGRPERSSRSNSNTELKPKQAKLNGPYQTRCGGSYGEANGEFQVSDGVDLEGPLRRLSIKIFTSDFNLSS